MDVSGDTFTYGAYDISEGNVTFIINCTGVKSAIERYPVIVDTMLLLRQILLVQHGLLE